MKNIFHNRSTSRTIDDLNVQIVKLNKDVSSLKIDFDDDDEPNIIAKAIQAAARCIMIALRIIGITQTVDKLASMVFTQRRFAIKAIKQQHLN